MNPISHKQAVKWIDRRLDGLLTTKQLSLLDEHLRSCDSCRAYAASMDTLPTRLQSEFHARWDEKSGPSQNLMQNVTAQTRNIPMTNRIFSGVKLIAGAAALIALGFAINFIVSQLQPTFTPATGTETVNNLPQAEDRLLAFASDQNGNSDIYTMRADGNGLINLTNDPAYDGNPIWSPDGKQLAFESDRSGSSQIYLMDADGSNVIQLTTDEAAHYLPVNVDGITYPWSPDGTKILYLQHHSGEKTSTLISQNIHEESGMPLTTGQLYYNGISWSPKGNYIGYLLDRSPDLSILEPNLYVADANGANPKDFKKIVPHTEPLDSRYRWSSNGESILFTTTRLDPPRGTAETIVYEYEPTTDTLLQKDNLQEMMDWEEAGRLVTEFRSFERADLIAVRQFPDGKGSLFDVDSQCSERIVRRSPRGNIAIGAYCPDNQFKLYWVNADRSTVALLLVLPVQATVDDPGDLSWSPDDRYIALNLESDQVTTYLVDVEKALADPSSQPVQVSVNDNKVYSIPAWQPVHVPKLAENSSKLAVDPRSCKPASELDSTFPPPNELYGYELVQGTSVIDGDFSYEFWLYCDPKLMPDEANQLNTIEGLGIFSSWSYNGPHTEGAVEYRYEFDPNIALGEGSWEGPLDQTSITGAKFGIDIPASEVQAYIQRRTPIQFRTIVDSPLGHREAKLSFNLESAEQGLRVASLYAEMEPLNAVDDALIAFVSAQSGNSDIYTMHADGSAVTNLTNEPAEDLMPFWSPDGKRIAFESDRSGSPQIYLMDADGSNVVQITVGETQHRFLDVQNPWSPDSTRLLLKERIQPGSTPETDEWTLSTLSLDGQERTTLAQMPATNLIKASWSPDGEHVAFIVLDPQNNRNAQIHVLDASGNNLADVTKLLPQDEELIDWNYSWSADGQSIFFIAGRTAWESVAGQSGRSVAYEVSLDGETLKERSVSNKRMTDWWNGTAIIEGVAAWSPVEWLRPDGSSQTWTTFEKCKQDGTAQYGYIHRRSSNGNLLFGVYCPGNELWLYWANSDGSMIKPLLGSPIHLERFEIYNITWSPDDKFVAFTISHLTQRVDMYILNVEAALNDPSEQPVKVVEDAIMIENLNWRPQPQ